jgi:anthranilate synthase component II
MKKILVIDNYDSFTYNLVHYIGNLTNDPIQVFRNDEISLEEIKKFDKILLSPGPGIPIEAGICLELIRTFFETKSILGVCLGHQAIGEAFGARLINLEKVYHGIATPIHVLIPDDALYNGVPEKFEGGRYHSWVIAHDGLPKDLKITAEDESKMIMGVSHEKYDVRGVQYHPESVLTEHGYKIIENWLKI